MQVHSCVCTLCMRVGSRTLQDGWGRGGTGLLSASSSSVISLSLWYKLSFRSSRRALAPSSGRSDLLQSCKNKQFQFIWLWPKMSGGRVSVWICVPSHEEHQQIDLIENKIKSLWRCRAFWSMANRIWHSPFTYYPNEILERFIIQLQLG